jgi:hypothetical protein
MESKHTSKTVTKAARTLSVLVFSFMCLVSVVVFATDEHVAPVDYILIVGAPFVMGAGAYFVVLHHDPTASE